MKMGFKGIFAVNVALIFFLVTWVTVSGAAPILPTVTISADPEEIAAGQTSTLSWSSTDADTASIEPGIGEVPVNGSLDVSPTVTTEYTITVTSGKKTKTASAIVTIIPPPIVSFTASPYLTRPAERVILSWSVENATSCVLEGVGAVLSTYTYLVYPEVTTTYTLTATGPGGTTVVQKEITVIDSPPVSSLAVATSGPYFNNVLNNPKQIIRTSSGQIYYFIGNGDFYFPGYYLKVITSSDGKIWSTVSLQQDYSSDTGIGVALDTNDRIHMVTYDGNLRPYYRVFNTKDSPEGNHSWGAPLIIDEDLAPRFDALSAIAVDGNDAPHFLYQKAEYMGATEYATLYYANLVNGTLHILPIVTVEDKMSVTKLDIAVGPDNIPYIMMNSKILKGNANDPTSFEEYDLGGQNYSFVIHQNGDVRVGFLGGENGHYCHAVHDATQPWDSGWQLFDSGNYYGGGTIILVDDIPYSYFAFFEGIVLQKEFELPILIAYIDPLYYDSVNDINSTPTTRWSFYNHHFPRVIDMGLRSNTFDYYSTNNRAYYFYTNFVTELYPNFSATPTKGYVPLEVSFQDRSLAVTDETIVSWEWDFENDGIVDATEEKPTHVYDETGIYTVSLTVTDSAGTSKTITRENHIIVSEDSDNDGILDVDDNCLGIFNPNQVDLDGDGIGYACDDMVSFQVQAGFETGLPAPDSPEAAPTDVNTTLSDGNFDSSIRIQFDSATYDALSFRFPVNVNDLATLTLNLYVSDLFEGSQPVTVYAFNADGISINTNANIANTLLPGWNSLDLSTLLPAMADLDFVKIRIVAGGSWVDISEAWLSGTSNRGVDDYDITATPAAVDFGSITEDTCAFTTLTIANTGSGELELGTAVLPASPFVLIEDNCSGQSLSVIPSSCNLTLAFCPAGAGEYADSLAIPSNDADNPTLLVSLTGSATVNQTTLTGLVADEVSALPVADAEISVQSLRLHPDFDPSQYSYTPEESWATAEDYEKARYNDGEKVVSTSYISSPTTVASHVFKVRNLYSTTSPFKYTWNGVGDNGYFHLLGQSFKAGQTGLLTDVSLSLDQELASFGIVRVYLMKEIGGEQNAILAESDYILAANMPSSWEMVSFHFSHPAMVSAGETYAIILYNSGGVNDYMSDLDWQMNTADSYVDGTGYSRVNATWTQVNDFIFTTYVDGQIDQQNTAGTETSSLMCWFGHDQNTTKLTIYNQRLSQWEQLGTHTENSSLADVTFAGIIDDNPSDYYDSEGWVTFMASYYDDIFLMDNFLISTDLFLVEFIENRTTTTDTFGTYSVSGLVPGDYTISAHKIGYYDKTENGTIAAGTTQVHNLQLASQPPFELAITSPLEGEVFPSTNIVTVTGTFTNDPEITVNGTSATILPDNIFTATVTLGYGEQLITVSGVDEFGQTASDTVSVTVPVRELSGLITHYATGLPLAGATVSILESDSSDWRSVTSLADGSYKIDGVALGSFTGQVEMEGYTTQPFSDTMSEASVITYNAVLKRVSPQISGLAVTNLSGTSATISWTTDQEATAMVEYGPTTAYGTMVSDPNLGTSHSITLTGLSYGTLYHFRVASTNSDGVTQQSADQTFATLGSPLISDILVSNITGNSATVSWTTDQATTSQVDYGKTTDYGLLVADTNFTTSHSMELNGLVSGTTYHFMITATNSVDLSSSSGDQVFDTLQVMTLIITAPTEGEIITSSSVLVQGTISGSAAEIGVTANGVIALVDNTSFAANHVYLQEGENTLTVRATDSEGNIAEATVNITSQPAAGSIKLIPDLESGINPLTVQFDIEATFDLATSSRDVSYTGPAAAVLNLISPEEFSLEVSTAGLYIITAEVTDAESNVYSDSFAILAMDQTVLDNLLQGKWEGMKTELSLQDIESGLGFFTEEAQPRYREIMNAIIEELPQIIPDMQGIEMIYSVNGTTKYRINRVQDINGTPVTITYYIYFVTNNGGLWKISQF
ncbi:MAG: carboxypeptidase regulatory-like domain-containing protein [Thermodesulfobacteriota bacterium]